MVVVGVLVNVVHLQLSHLAQHLLQRLPLVVHQGVDQAVTRSRPGRVFVREVHQA